MLGAVVYWTHLFELICGIGFTISGLGAVGGSVLTVFTPVFRASEDKLLVLLAFVFGLILVSGGCVLYVDSGGWAALYG
jgi:hypothetical protein